MARTRWEGGLVADLEGFREETREWLEENCPPTKRGPDAVTEEVWGGRNAVFKHPDTKLWLERMAAQGWTAPIWPKEYGGGGLSDDEAKILRQEMQRLRCRLPLMSFGISMLGPVLLEFANEEQKREHLPKIARGEIRWCQGYSEPGAGSDLASLQMRAVLDGDEYVVNGQKIWISYADKSDWIFCLVRTGPDTPKHDGISFLLIDMASPGVSTAPIRLISGYSPFCQTFFEDVRVPKENLVGPVNGGWTIAKRLLQFERSVISEGFGISSRKRSLEELARRYLDCPAGPLPDPALRSRLAQEMMEDECFGLTLKRSAEETKAGHGPGAASSMFKYYGTELNKRRYELMILLLGTQGLGWEGEGFEPDELLITREWLRSKANSIEGGTSEIQLNIIAKRVLGLPD